MTIKQAAQQLRLSEQLVRVWCQNGTCPFGYVIRLGERNTYYINEAELKRFINGEHKNE